MEWILQVKHILKAVRKKKLVNTQAFQESVIEKNRFGSVLY